MNWTEDRVAELKRLHAEDKSCSQIAAVLGGVSRNAVIGKLHRMGMKGAGNAGRIFSGGRKPREPKERQGRPSFRYDRKPNTGRRIDRERQAERFAVLFTTETTADLTMEQRAKTVTLIDLGPGNCRWPLGHPGKADFCFCGDTPEPDKPYCSPHWQLGHERAARRA